MSSKRILVSIPEEMLPEIDAAAKREHRSRSDLVREALRRYLAPSKSRYIPVADPEPEEVEAVRQAEDEFARGEFVKLDDLQHALGLDRQ